MNSALDNPASYFTSSAMNSRSSDLGKLLDNMNVAASTLKATDAAVQSITKLVEVADGIARDALQSPSGEKNAVVAAGYGINCVNGKEAAEELNLVKHLNFDEGDQISFGVSSHSGSKTSVSIKIDEATSVKDLVETINGKLQGRLSADIDKRGKLTLEAVGGGDIRLDLTETVGGKDNDFRAMLSYFVRLNGATNLTAVTNSDQLHYRAPKAEFSKFRQNQAERYNEVLDQINGLADDAGFNGINLLRGDNLDVVVNEKSGSKANKISLKGMDLGYEGLGLGKIMGGFQSDGDIEVSLAKLSKALKTLQIASSDFGSKQTMVDTRRSFTTAMIDTLDQGSRDLTLADMNREGAYMMTLQTRQQLAAQTLGLANQSDRTVLGFL